MMSVNKVLHLDGFRFLLPDEFRGSLADAFRLVAVYLNEPKTPLEQSDLVQDKILTQKQNDAVWVEFIKTVNLGRRLYGVVGLVEWDENELRWDSMPLRTGGGL